MTSRLMLALAALAASALLTPPLLAQPTPKVSDQLKDPKAANVQIVGHVVEPKQLKPTDDLIRQHIKLPPGFTITKFTDGLENPRILAAAPDGAVYATRRDKGDVVLLRDDDRDGRADRTTIVAQFPGLHGIAIHGDKVYLAAVKDVFVTDRKPDGTLGVLTRLIADLPDGGQHPNRTLAIGPDGMLYVSVGSTCNECDETNGEAATLLRSTPDGKSRSVFAAGLRNTIGFAWHPTTKQLWGMDHGIDWLGDNEQDEELNRLLEGKNYGWPYIYADGRVNPHIEPKDGQTMEQLRAASTNPDLLYTPHSAPMQMTFYTGTAFPAEYRNDAFVAMRGSWNRKPPSGYEVVRIRFDEAGKPEKIEPFATGFLIQDGPDSWSHLGRLCGLTTTPDGALLLSDDKNGVIYRITYKP